MAAVQTLTETADLWRIPETQENNAHGLLLRFVVVTCLAFSCGQHYPRFIQKKEMWVEVRVIMCRYIILLCPHSY